MAPLRCIGSAYNDDLETPGQQGRAGAMLPLPGGETALMTATRCPGEDAVTETEVLEAVKLAFGLRQRSERSR